jgi:hypothetical protein
MPSPLVVAVGMPRAGSGWHYNFIHDLVVANGGQNASVIRRRFLLQKILTEVNCNIGAFTARRLLPVMFPAYINNYFVVKAHAGPSPLALRLIRSGMLQPLYIYRDPRDALLSAFEYGQRKRKLGRTGAFAELREIDAAIVFMVEYVQISKAWLSCTQALHTRYEDFLINYPGESKKIVDFLDLDYNENVIQEVVRKFQPERGSSNQPGTHFVKGKIGRYREVFSEEEQLKCIEAFSPYLVEMGFPVP